MGEEATNGQEKARSGIQDPFFALERAREMEQELAQLKGRLQLLVNQSPVLQANTDELNRMEDVIFKVETQISNYRTAATFALTAELTGTGRIVPTDEALFNELREARK